MGGSDGRSRMFRPTNYLFVSTLTLVALHVLVPVAQIVPGPWVLLGCFPLVFGPGLRTG